MVEYTLVNLIAFGVGLAFLVNGYMLVKQGREAIALFVVSVAIGGGLIFVASSPTSSRSSRRSWGLS